MHLDYKHGQALKFPSLKGVNSISFSEICVKTVMQDIPAPEW